MAHKLLNLLTEKIDIDIICERDKQVEREKQIIAEKDHNKYVIMIQECYWS